MNTTQLGTPTHNHLEQPQQGTDCDAGSVSVPTSLCINVVSGHGFTVSLCFVVSLFHCSTVPLFHCSTVPLFHCSTVPLFHCSTDCFTFSRLLFNPFLSISCVTLFSVLEDLQPNFRGCPQNGQKWAAAQRTLQTRSV